MNGGTMPDLGAAMDAAKEQGIWALAGMVVTAVLYSLQRAFSAKKAAEAVVKAEIEKTKPEMLEEARLTYADIITRLEKRIEALEEEGEKKDKKIGQLETELNRYRQKLNELKQSVTGEMQTEGLGPK